MQTASNARHTTTPGASLNRNNLALLWRPEIIDPRVDWSVEYFMDVLSGNGGAWIYDSKIGRAHV